MTTRVDYYLLPYPSQLGVDRFTARLLEKIYKQGTRLDVLVESKEQAEALDSWLWTYNDISFLPHEIAETPSLTGAPIAIYTGMDRSPSAETLLNLSHHLPPHYAAFQRVLEFVTSDAKQKQGARERYRSYRDAGCEVQTHEIKEENKRTDVPSRP